MINDRIRQLIENECKGNKRAFAQRVGISPSSIENVVGSRGGKPSFDLLEKILCAFEDIDANWLILGKGREASSKENITPAESNILTKLLDQLQELNEKVAEQSKTIGALEMENKHLKETTASVVRDAGDAGCAVAG